MAPSLGQCCRSFYYDSFLTYTTIKVVKIPNTYIAVIYRLVQLIIFFYIVGYIVIWKKGYQEFGDPHGTSVIKMKGVARATEQASSVKQIWDSPEYQIPPLENNALFIVTRQIVTYDQTEGVCPAAFDKKLVCTNETVANVCRADAPTPSTVGYLTGKCVSSRENSSINICEMRGWCPEELSQSKDYLINPSELENFTIFLKTMVTFSSLKITLRNIRETTDFSCRFDGTAKTSDCPIIRLGYILDRLTTNRTALLHEGGLIEIQQDWTCNFDRNVKYCTPTYRFSLLQSGDDAKSPGINYRFAQKYFANNTEYRLLSKLHGLRFVITITGKGGQFNIVNLFLAIGSGIGFMAIAGLVSDIILVYCHRSRRVYRDGKFSVCEMDSDDPGSVSNLTHA